jgi:hypothetical protein
MAEVKAGEYVDPQEAVNFLVRFDKHPWAPRVTQYAHDIDTAQMYIHTTRKEAQAEIDHLQLQYLSLLDRPAKYMGLTEEQAFSRILQNASFKNIIACCCNWWLNSWHF